MNKNSILEKETAWRNKTIKFLFKTRKNKQVSKELLKTNHMRHLKNVIVRGTRGPHTSNARANWPLLGGAGGQSCKCGGGSRFIWVVQSLFLQFGNLTYISQYGNHKTLELYKMYLKILYKIFCGFVVFLHFLGTSCLKYLNKTKLIDYSYAVQTWMYFYSYKINMFNIFN